MAVRFIRQENVGGSNFVLYVEGFCDSDDSKPTGSFATGSKLTEVDTGSVFYYNEKDSSWAVPTPAETPETPADDS